MNYRRVTISGVPADCVTRATALEAADEMLRGGPAQSILAVNPEKVIAATDDPRLLNSLEHAGLLLPDGIGVVMAARLLGLGRMERVPGCEFMLALCDRSARQGYRLFLFGASPDVNARTEQVLRQRYPGILIVGRQHGYVSDGEMPGVVRAINASGAEIVFVALGSPKQELWIDSHRPHLRVKICQGVGGTFDVIAGRVRRAPPLIRAARLEWLYRLVKQPKRLVRQTALPRFVAHTLRTVALNMISASHPRGRRDASVRQPG